jgi:transcription elongation factor GreA
MSVSRVPMTVAGEATLRAELNRLKTIDRPRIVQAIAEAREHGDLKEHAEYHAAREQQGFSEGRVKEIEGKLSDSVVIDISTIAPTGKVIFGVTVTIINCETEAEVTYKIVGEDEASINLGKISVTSPIARALMTKEEGDEVVVQTPGGRVEFEIGQIQHL